MADPNPSTRWLDPLEAAAALRVTRKFIYKLIRRGDLAAHRFCGVWRIQRVDVDAFIAATRKPARRQKSGAAS